MLTTIILGVIASLVANTAHAAIGTNATCSPDYQWMNNSLDQTPCYVAAMLLGVCNHGDWFFAALGPHQTTYEISVGASVEHQPCECNGPLYNLASACAICQGGLGESAIEFFVGCFKQYESVGFPYSLPALARVPPYAFIDITDRYTFDINEAKRRVDNHEPESFGPGGPTPTASTTSPTSKASPSHSPPPAPQPNTKTPVGAIVGGVVGGVFIVLTVIGGCIYWRRRSRNSTMAHTTLAVDERSNDEKWGGKAAPLSPLSPQSLASPLQPVYNPNDPSTFPRTPTIPGLTYYHQPSTRPQSGITTHGYTGSPEV